MGAIPEMMVSVGETPWHRQGLVLPEDTVLTPREAYELGGLDYQITKTPILDNDTFTPLEDRWLLKRVVRDKLNDIMIGKQPQIVSSRYEIIQNDAIPEIVDDLGLPVITAGTMFNSSMAWMLLDLGDSIAFRGTDEATNRFLLVATHHGTGNFVIYVVTVRVVCQNTYDLATRFGDLRWTIRHTSSAQDRLAEARQGLERAYRAMDDMDVEIQQLMDKPFRQSQWDMLLDTVQPTVMARPGVKPNGEWGTINKRAVNAAIEARLQLRKIWENENGTIADQSAFHAIQAVNEYEQHYHGHGKNRDKRMMAKFIKGDFPMTAKATQTVKKLVGV